MIALCLLCIFLLILYFIVGKKAEPGAAKIAQPIITLFIGVIVFSLWMLGMPSGSFTERFRELGLLKQCVSIVFFGSTIFNIFVNLLKK